MRRPALVPLAYVRRSSGRRAGAARAAERRRRSTRRSTRSTGSSSPAARTSTRRSTAQEPHPETNGTRPERDARRAGAPHGGARARHAGARDLPRLAGAERRARRRPRPAPAGRVGDEQHKHSRASSPTTTSTLRRAARLGALLGERAPVKSHHHQGFGRVGDGPRRDGLGRGRHARGARGPVAAVRGRRALAPGGGRGRALFEALVDEARAYRARGSDSPERRRRERWRRRSQYGDRAEVPAGTVASVSSSQTTRGSCGCSCRLCLHGCISASGQRSQELRHARVVLGEPLIEPELAAGLLGHAETEQRTAVAAHVAAHHADEDTAEDRGDAEVRRSRPCGTEGAERHRPDGRTAIPPIATPSLPTARAFAS